MAIVHLVHVTSTYMGMTLMRPPSGLLYVGGYLKQNGFTVAVHHVRASDIDKALEEIRSAGPVLFVGFSVMTGTQVSATAEMSLRLKRVMPGVPVVWGGIHPSCVPEGCLAFDFVDYVVIGEGEVTALDLACHLRDKADRSPSDVPGIGFKEAGTPVITASRPFAANIDEFRQDWSLVNVRDYVVDGHVFCFITSRGCPHSCGFCYNQQFNRRRWRPHSVERVVSELLDIRSQTGFTHVYFSDDNFFTDRQRGLEILRRLKQHGISCVGLEVRVDYVTEELVREIVDLGVQSIFFGWESGCKRTLDRISKGFTPALILEKLKILCRYPQLHVDCAAIIGFPWETDDDVHETVALALEMFRHNPYRLAIYFHNYLPYPGAPVTSEALQRGFAFPVSHEDWRQFDELEGRLEVPWLTRRRARRYARLAKYVTLLHVPQLSEREKRVRKLFALCAYARLRTGVTAFPFDLRWFEAYDDKRKRAHEQAA